MCMFAPLRPQTALIHPKEKLWLRPKECWISVTAFFLKEFPILLTSWNSGIIVWRYVNIALNSVRNFTCCFVYDILYLPVWSKRPSARLCWLIFAGILFWLVVLKWEKTQNMNNKEIYEVMEMNKGFTHIYIPLALLDFCLQCQYRLHPPSSKFLHPNRVPEIDPQVFLDNLLPRSTGVIVHLY